MSTEEKNGGNFLGLPPGWPRVVAGLGAAGVIAALLVYLVVGLARNYDHMREQRTDFLRQLGEMKARQQHIERLLEGIADQLRKKE